MPDRLSQLLHEVDDVPTTLPPAADVRRRGVRLRRRRQATAGGGVLALLAVVAVGAGALTGGQERLDSSPAVPPAPSPDARPSETPPARPDRTPAPTTLPTDATAPPSDVETSESDLGFLRGFGERDGVRTLLLDRVLLLQGEPGRAEAARRGLPDPGPDTVLVNENPRVREYLLPADASVAVADPSQRTQRRQGLYSEIGAAATLAELERGHASLRPGEEILLDVRLAAGVVVSLVESTLVAGDGG